MDAVAEKLASLSRWTFASLSSYLDSKKGTFNAWYQGNDTPNPDWQAWAEVYMGGPRWRQVSHSWVTVQMEVMIGLLVKDSVTDAHLPFRLRDQFANALNLGVIPCYRYGDTPGDDQSLIGCYTLRSDIKNPVDGYDYASVDPVTKLSRATVEGYFTMGLSI